MTVTSRTRRLSAALIIGASALGLSACGGSDDSASKNSVTKTAEASATSQSGFGPEGPTEVPSSSSSSSSTTSSTASSSSSSVSEDPHKFSNLSCPDIYPGGLDFMQAIGRTLGMGAASGWMPSRYDGDLECSVGMSPYGFRFSMDAPNALTTSAHVQSKDGTFYLYMRPELFKDEATQRSVMAHIMQKAEAKMAH